MCHSFINYFVKLSFSWRLLYLSYFLVWAEYRRVKRVRGRSTSGGRGGGEPPPGPAAPVPCRPASTPVGLVTGLASKSKYFLKNHSTRFFSNLSSLSEFFLALFVIYVHLKLISVLWHFTMVVLFVSLFVVNVAISFSAHLNDHLIIRELRTCQTLVIVTRMIRECLSGLVILRYMSRSRIHGHNWDKGLKSFPPWYSQSPLLTDFTPPPPSGKRGL